MMEESVYSIANNQEESRVQSNQEIICERYVAFFDIMGFKDTVARTELSELMERISNLMSFVKKQFMEETDFKYSIFSDSIFVFVPKSVENAFHKLLERIGKIMSFSINRGFAIKGAVAEGKCMVTLDESPTFFGQPIIDAYCLEEEMVIYGVAMHNTVEREAVEEAKLGTLFDYKLPLKNGSSNHYVLKWWSDNTSASVIDLKNIRNNVSGRPRRYIDNTLDCIRESNNLDEG